MYSCLVQELFAENWELGHLSQQQSKLPVAYVVIVSRFKDVRQSSGCFFTGTSFSDDLNKNPDCLGFKSWVHVTPQCSVIIRLGVV